MNLPPVVVQIILWVVAAIILVFLFQAIVLPLIHTLTK